MDFLCTVERCSRTSGGTSKYRCRRPVREPNAKFCHVCWTRQKARDKKRLLERRVCKRCKRKYPYFILTKCWRCKAYEAESKHPRMEHDRTEHARLLRACYNPKSRCAVTGFSKILLSKMGLFLTVDRIDPRKGYVRNNMQLLTSSLNAAKSNRMSIPSSVVKQLRKRATRYVRDNFTAKRRKKLQRMWG